MNHPKSYIYLFIIILSFSCEKQDTPSLPTPLLECIGFADEFYDAPLECSTLFLDSIYCGIVNIGEFEIESSSREYMADYCKLTDDIINFNNEQGETINFIITNKNFTTIRSSVPTQEYCDLDSLGRIAVCYQTELLSMTIKSSDPELEMRIVIEAKPARKADNQGEVGEYLSIDRIGEMNSFVRYFYALVNQRTLPTNVSLANMEQLTTFVINSTTYNDVLTNNVENHPDQVFQYYANKEFGFFAFKDLDGVLWEKQ